ncbi:MAG: trypsin-like serine protease [Melioribacteraceae bacterium]|nr:trypsin-like serine protease [Melioribacteraceae bacterium]
MKYLIIFLATICTLFAGNYKDNIDVKNLDVVIKKYNFSFVGNISNEKNVSLGTCHVINENTVITNASILQTRILIPDTTVINGNEVITQKEIGRSWIDKSNLHINMDGKKYAIEKIIPHPDYNENNEYLPNIAMVLTKENINCRYPQLSNTLIEKNFTYSILGYEKSCVYGTNKVDSRFNNNNFNYCSISLDTKEQNSNSTIFEFNPDSSDKGFALLKVVDNDVILIGLLQDYKSNEKESIFLDLSDIIDWLNTNAISQITR